MLVVCAESLKLFNSYLAKLTTILQVQQIYSSDLAPTYYNYRSTGADGAGQAKVPAKYVCTYM